MIPQVFLSSKCVNTPITSPCCLVFPSLCISDNIRIIQVLTLHIHNLLSTLPYCNKCHEPNFRSIAYVNLFTSSFTSRMYSMYVTTHGTISKCKIKFSYLFLLSSTTDILTYSICLCMTCTDCRNALSE